MIFDFKHAKTLGGHGAEHFAPLKNLGGIRLFNYLPEGITNNSTMQELIEALPYSAILISHAGSPLVPNNYTSLTVMKIMPSYVIAFAKSQINNAPLYVGSTGEDNKWGGWVGVFPLTGGRVENVTFGEALKVKRTDVYDSVTTYENSNGVLGYIGMGNTEKPIYTDKTKAKTYELLHTGNRLEFIGTVSGIENALTFDKTVYKELYCELSYFGSAKVTLDIVPNGGNYYSGLETSAGTLGGSVKVHDNTIKATSFYYEDISRNDSNVTLSVWGKR